MTLKTMLEEKAKKHATKPAIKLGENTLSFSELDECFNKLANGLIKLGVQKGDRVAFLLSNHPEFVVCYFGTIKAGAIAVPLDTRYKVEELTTLFGDCQPKVLISESPFLEPLVVGSIEQVIDLSAKPAKPFLGYQEILTSNPSQSPAVRLEPEDVSTIFYTSSITRHPRGVMLPHKNLLSEVAIIAEAFQQTEDDVTMIFALPLFHVFGLVAALLTSLSVGGTVVIAPGLSISHLMETVEKERGSIFMGVPSAYLLAVNMAERDGIEYDLSSLRLCLGGGAPMPPDIAASFQHHFGLEILQIWGLTEATALVTCQSLDGTRKFGSMGKVCPGWELKIVDDEDQELPRNQEGEILVRGTPVMKGYYNNPQATNEAIKDGWLYTGDLGRVDEDGHLFISGRKKDMIIVGGQNVYLSDIEEVLYAHPKIAETATVGIPDKLRGEAVKAVIVLKEGETATEGEIRRFCREQLADYKVPRKVEFRAFLPRTDIGKVRKKGL